MAAEKQPRHPIGVVSSRTGIPQDVLRAWERRYNAVQPQRTETGRRLYSDLDLLRFRLLKTAVDSGRRISDVAGMTLSELEKLAAEDRAALPAGSIQTAPEPPRGSGTDPALLLRQALDAVEDMDGDRLRATLNEAAVTMTPTALRNDLVIPLMVETGERWRKGTLRIAHEHLASSTVRSFLGAISLRSRVVGGPRIILTTPVGSEHEFGALIAAHCAVEVGWEPIFLGPTLPAAEIAAAARSRKAAAVGLSIVFPPSSPALQDELRRVRELLDDDVALLVGGTAVDGYRETLEEIGAHAVPELIDFQAILEKLSGEL